MKVSAKITGIVFIAIGVIIMISAIFIGIGGTARIAMIPRMAPRVGVAIPIIAGGLVFGQGMLLAGFGQMLYLMAEIADKVCGAEKSESTIEVE